MADRWVTVRLVQLDGVLATMEEATTAMHDLRNDALEILDVKPEASEMRPVDIKNETPDASQCFIRTP